MYFVGKFELIDDKSTNFDYIAIFIRINDLS